jgi:ketosteroid isomerase-like protein
MSQENVELVRKSMNAFAERDVEAMRELNDPEVELDWSASLGVEARVYSGFDSVLRFYMNFFEAFEGIVWEELSFIDAGEHVVARNMSRSRGRDGIEVFARATLVFTVRDRKITRICLYQEQDDALKAVGLAE